MNKTILLLLLVVVGSVACVVLLLFDDPMGGSASDLERDLGDGGDPSGLHDAEGARLASAPNARRPPTAEELEAQRRAAMAPTFPREEGVFGQVTDGRGTPIAKATVLLTTQPEGRRQSGMPDPPALATTATDEKGEFLVGPAPSGGLRVRAQAPGYAPTVKALKRRGYRVVLVLDRGGRLELLAKNGAGEPVPGARVLHQAGIVVSEATTDDQGVARFESLPTGTGTVIVTKEGYAAVRQQGVAVAPAKTEQRTIVLPKPLLLEGTVTDEASQTPIPGASILVRYSNQPWLEPTGPVVTDEDGAFEVDAFVAAGERVTLETESADHAPSRKWIQLQDTGDGSMKVEIKLRSERGVLVGRVEDADGHAVAGARVTYPWSRRGSDNPEATTDESGAFELMAATWMSRPGSSSQIVALADDRGIGTANARVAKEGEAPNPVTIRLTGVGRVAGTIVDGDDRPVSGALVMLTVDWSAMSQMVRSNQRGVMSWGLTQVLQNPRLVRLDAITDDEGEFAIESVPVAAYRLTATFGLESATAEETVTIRSGDTVERQLTLGEGATIEGWVLDLDEQPVPGAYVNAQVVQRGPQRGWSPGSWISGRSQVDGRFVVHGATADAYNVTATASGYQSRTEKDVAPQTTELTLTLKPLGWIAGVVEQNGKPYAGTFSVRARRVREKRSNRPRNIPFSPRGGANTFSPDDGTFQLKNLQGGEYDLTTSTPEGMISPEPVRVQVLDGRATEVELTLVAGAIVTGRLVDDRTGEPVANARISVRTSGGTGRSTTTSASTRTDADGRFTARGLAGGTYTLTAQPSGGIPVHRSIDLQAGETRYVELRQQPPGSIQIYVTDAEGRPVAGVRSTVRVQGGSVVWPNWQALQREGIQFGPNTWNEQLSTDDSGMNLRRHLAPGTYEVNATHGGYQPAPKVTVKVSAGRVAEAQLVLRPKDGG